MHSFLQGKTGRTRWLSRCCTYPSNKVVLTQGFHSKVGKMLVRHSFEHVNIHFLSPKSGGKLLQTKVFHNFIHAGTRTKDRKDKQRAAVFLPKQPSGPGARTRAGQTENYIKIKKHHNETSNIKMKHQNKNLNTQHIMSKRQHITSKPLHITAKFQHTNTKPNHITTRHHLRACETFKNGTKIAHINTEKFFKI